MSPGLLYQGIHSDGDVAAFLGQPAFLKVRDVDKDSSPDRDSLSVRLVSTYKREEEEEEYTPSMTVNIEKLLEEEKKPDPAAALLVGLGLAGATGSALSDRLRRGGHAVLALLGAVAALAGVADGLARVAAGRDLVTALGAGLHQLGTQPD